MSLISPVLSRLREDKSASLDEAGVAQIADRVLVPDLGRTASAVSPARAAGDRLADENVKKGWDEVVAEATARG